MRLFFLGRPSEKVDQDSLQKQTYLSERVGQLIKVTAELRTELEQERKLRKDADECVNNAVSRNASLNHELNQLKARNAGIKGELESWKDRYEKLSAKQYELIIEHRSLRNDYNELRSKTLIDRLKAILDEQEQAAEASAESQEPEPPVARKRTL